MIETMLAISLLCAIVYTSTSVLSKASKSEAEDTRKWTASETGSMVMEELSFSYATSDILEAGHHVRYYDHNYSEVNEADGRYTVGWDVTENTPKQGILSIKLVVSWTEGPNEHVINYETLR